MQQPGDGERFVRRFSLQLRPFGSHLRLASPRIHLSRVRTPISSEQLLQQLNGQTIVVGPTTWRIDVYSIVENDGYRWVQVGLDGGCRRTVLLKLEYLADDKDAIAALEDWLDDSTALHGGVLTVSDSD